jgi:hypothetical protein
MLLPRGLNLVYDEWGGEKASGCLLHAKFLTPWATRREEELKRGRALRGRARIPGLCRRPDERTDLWCKWSEKYINWRQLEILGLMSKGNWA